MSGIDAVILDVDGTIVRGENLIPGALTGLRAIDAAGCPRLLFSNNPTRGAAEYGEKLLAHDIEVDPSSVLTSASVSASYLSDHHATDRIYLVGESRLRSILEAAGLTVTTDPTEADVVLGSIDLTFTYEALCDAVAAFERDVAYYGTDPDPIVPGQAGRAPGSGAILGALSAIAGRSPDAILGKPSQIAADAALSRLDADPARTLVVGDRLDTDVALGDRTGMTTVLVRTGVTDADALASSPIEPDYVLDDLGEIARVLD